MTLKQLGFELNLNDTTKTCYSFRRGNEILIVDFVQKKISYYELHGCENNYLELNFLVLQAVLDLVKQNAMG